MNFKFPFFSKKQKIVANTDQIVDAKGRKLSDLLGSNGDDKDFENATVIDLDEWNKRVVHIYESDVYGTVAYIDIPGLTDDLDMEISNDRNKIFEFKYGFADNNIFHHPVIFTFTDNGKKYTFKGKLLRYVGNIEDNEYEAHVYGDTFFMYCNADNDYTNGCQLVLSDFKTDVLLCNEYNADDNELGIINEGDVFIFAAAAVIPNFKFILPMGNAYGYFNTISHIMFNDTIWDAFSYIFAGNYTTGNYDAMFEDYSIIITFVFNGTITSATVKYL